MTRKSTSALDYFRGASAKSNGGSEDFNGRLVALGLLIPIVGKERENVIRQPDYRGVGLAMHHLELSDYGRQFLAAVGAGEFPWPARLS